MTPAPHGAAPASTDQTVTTSAVTRVSSANGGASAPAPTGTVRGPQNGTSDLTALLATIRATLDAATPGPWEVEGDDGFGHSVYKPGGWGTMYICDGLKQGHSDGLNDATFIASAPVTVARLLAAVESVLAYGVDRENYTDTGNPEADKAIRSYAYHVRRLIDSALEGER